MVAVVYFEHVQLFCEGGSLEFDIYIVGLPFFFGRGITLTFEITGGNH